MPTYKPEPIVTAHIILSDDQLALIEALTENAHEIWAEKRMAEGWTWGEQRDDVRKHHPCLVAYADLPDSEKQYDRAIVEETIKAALAIGYEIASKNGADG